MTRLALISLLVMACGNDGGGGGGDECAEPPGPFAEGSLEGHPQPLGAAPGQARAGRVGAADLPAVPSGLITWQDGDFVLANDRVALVIEDVGDSDLYDPWGGRPVGLARVSGGRMIEPNNFGELFLLTGRSTVLTDSVSVIADGSDGGPAIVRARGKLHPLPFFEALTAGVFRDPWTDIDAAIDYELAPGAEHVDVRYRFASARTTADRLDGLLHAVMYTERTPVYQPGLGFDDALAAPFLALVDDRATSWAYLPGEGALASSLSVSGFLGAFSAGFAMPACGSADRLHARLVIGGPGLDGVQAAVARTRGEPQRAITGTVSRTGEGPAAGVRVHALDAATDGYLTRATSDGEGRFTLHVPAAASVRLDAYTGGESIVAQTVGAATTAAVVLPQLGAIRVTASDGGSRAPVRVQVFPPDGQPASTVPDRYGEPRIPAGRQLVRFAPSGDVTLAVPPGTWQVVVSRGYEYELVRATVTVAAGATVTVAAELERVVDTTGVVCGDFHVHTWRSNDSGDDALDKLAQAVGDGVELPVRSEHEYVADFRSEIEQLALEPFAAGFGSIELTSFELWGHMGVFPLVPDATANAGAPRWQTFPTADAPDTPFATLSPPAVFDAVRARPEAPVVIINHPRGGANYFDYVGFDPATGLAELPGELDPKLILVEVFNDSGWLANRERNVADWFGLLRAGRRVFAVGSSDSHGLVGTPVGYPRTCIAAGTDDPRELVAAGIRDQLAAGRSTISGGVYVTAQIGPAGPGDTVTGAGSPIEVDVTIRAASWIDVDAIDVVVDGVTVDTIPIMPGDADPEDPAIRWRKPITVQTAATGGFVVIAAYGDGELQPVHPRKIPFGVTNPIFVAP